MGKNSSKTKWKIPPVTQNLIYVHLELEKKAVKISAQVDLHSRTRIQRVLL